MDLDRFELEPFQVPGYRQLVTNFRHLLLWYPGLGKTVACVKAIYDIEARSVLIVCPKNAIKVWENHIREWFDGLDVASGKTTDDTETTFHIWRWRKRSQNADQRRTLWRSVDLGAKVNIYITTYAAFINDHEHFVQRYDTIIADEAKRIRNRKSHAFLHLKPLCKQAKYVWLLTGTPGFKPEHFWTMFHLLDPKLYGSYWKFVGAFYVTLTNHFGGLELIAFKNQESWFDLLRRKATILSKKDVGHQETIRARRFADLDKDQIRLLKEYEEDMYATLPDRLDIVSTSLTQTLRYRQLLCCPKIVDPTLSIGGSLVDLVETFKEEEASPFCVIFVPFTEAFQHFIAYLEANGITNVQTLSGGISPDEQDERISKWRTHGKSPILVSILYAQAFSLEPATEAYFIGYDWDPDNNTQAEERLNRLTTKEAVTAFYYTFEDTYDERQLEIVNTKQRQKNKVMPQK